MREPNESPAPYVSEVLHDMLKDYEDEELAAMLRAAPEMLDALELAKKGLARVYTGANRQVIQETFNTIQQAIKKAKWRITMREPNEISEDEYLDRIQRDRAIEDGLKTAWTSSS